MMLTLAFVFPLWIHFMPSTWSSPASTTVSWRVFFTVLVIFESAMLLGMVFDLKRKKEVTANYLKLTYLLVPPLFVIMLLFLFLYYLFTERSDLSFLNEGFLNYVYLHVAESVISPSMSAILKPTGRERAWIEERLMYMHGRACTLKMNSHQALFRKDVDELASKIALLEADARAFDLSIDTKPTRAILPELYARCSIRESTEGAKAISIEQLRAASTLPEDSFSTIVLKMCDMLGLIVDGKIIKAKDGRDMSALLADVDGFFTRWHENEAVKLGKS